MTEAGVAEFYRPAQETVFHTQDNHCVLVVGSERRVVGMIDIRVWHHISLFFDKKIVIKKAWEKVACTTLS
ncbi:hypothetical protein [Teredinibacter haidensis]|uniref:hypothetical protein n=1 Tax=Teredinibacter haidensis TaxID=2731755 RepID=UPI000948D48A|nr:hypothetical protein [Teredinibacter haidensis]